ncbi:hypothetical protein ACHAXR_010835 [Thalassiosira sp. AJA248-18]
MAATAVTPGVSGVAYAAPPAAVSSTTSQQQRAVSFGFGSLKTPTAAEAAAAAAAAAASTNPSNDNNATTNHEETLRQYSLYRSSPNQFPSYDRLRFVRLPREWLPTGLQQQQQPQRQLHHWPALVYQNLAELVRDLSPVESKMLKARLIVEHRKCPTTVVARLLGWGSSSNSSNNNPFEEKRLEMIRLSGSSLEDNEHSGMYEDELISFVDGQLELESVCDGLLVQHAPASAGTSDAKVFQHAVQFRKAVDMALNCLALDVGADPLPARNDDEAPLMTPTNNNVANNGTTTAAGKLKSSMRTTPSAGNKKNVFSVEKIKAMETTKAMNAAKMKACSTDNTNYGGDQARHPVRKDKIEKSRSKKKVKAAMATTVTRAAPDKENQRNATSSNMESKKSNNGPPKGLTARNKVAAAVPRKKSPKKFQSAAAARHNKKPTSTKSTTSFARLPSKPTSVRSTTSNAAAAAAPTSFDFDHQHPTTAVPLEEESISWKDVWSNMKRSGWTWKGGSGLMTDYYYIKPGCKVKDGKQGRDYFISEKDAQAYARNVYGWGTVGKDKLMTTIEEYAKYAGEVVPSLKEGVAIESFEPWREVWQKMLDSGWTWKPGSGLMMDYYYVKPDGKIKGGTEGRDYFCRKEDVQKFAKRNYGWRGEQEDLGTAVVDEDNGAVMGEKRRSSSGSRSSGEFEVQGKRQKVERARVATKKMADLKAAIDNQVAANEQKKPAEKKPERKDPMDSDDNDEMSTSDARSTYSQSGFQSKTLFIEECADESVPPLKYPIRPAEPWRDAWDIMLQSGWTWKMGSGLMTDYYYIKPGCRVKGGVKGQDYFETAEGAQKFAMRNYGWRGQHDPNKGSPDKKRRNSSDNKKNAAVADEDKNKRQKVVECAKSPKHKALASLKAHKALKAKSPKAMPSRPPPPPNPYEKKATWQAMQKEGWTAISAGKYNKLHDWYYVRPNCNPGDGKSQLGVDYFLCEDDAIESVRRSQKHSRDIKDKKMVERVQQKTSNEKAGNGLLTPADCRTKPQDPAIPLLSSPDKSCSSTTSQDDYYEWKNLWPVLSRAGWTFIKAGRYNPLHDWYYVRPNRDPSDESSKLGRHYFLCQDDVCDFAKRLDKKSSQKGSKKSSRKSLGVMMGAFEEEAKARDF